MPGRLFFDNEKVKQTYETLAALPGECPAIAMRYLELFRKPDGREMTKDRELGVARELAAIIGAGWAEYKGNPARRANPKMWADGMLTMIERAAQKRLELPMKNHNYLKSIVYDIADTADRKTETVRNKAERTGAFKRPETPFGGMTPEERKAIRIANMNKAKEAKR
jgi:hypothetical protein